MLKTFLHNHLKGHPRIAMLVHRCEGFVHIIYCGAVAIEGHGVYAAAGGVLGVLIFLALVIHE